MRILMLTVSDDVTDGWGRYACGFRKEAERRGHEVVFLGPDRIRSGAFRWYQPFAALFEALRFRKEASRADLIHVLTEPCAPLAAMLKKLTGTPMLISVIGSYSVLETYPRRVRGLFAWAFSQADGAAVLSTYTDHVVGETFKAPVREIVHGGFEGHPDAVPRKGFRRPVRLLSVGALKPRKGFHTLVPALGRLKEKGIDFACDIVGDASSEEYVGKIREAIGALGLDRNVHLQGKISEADLEAAYREADLFVLPSERIGTEFEGLGLVYLEAMARGLPCVGCLDSGAIDIIKDGVNGRLVPGKDPEALAGGIADMLFDEERYRRLSEEALRTVGAFRWSVVGDKMDAVQRRAAEQA